MGNRIDAEAADRGHALKKKRGRESAPTNFCRQVLLVIVDAHRSQPRLKLPIADIAAGHLGFEHRDLGADQFAIFFLGGDERFEQIVNTPLVILIALPDFLSALRSVIENQTASGIYQIADDYPITLQDFLDQLADHFGFSRPWRLPAPVFHIAGFSVEVAALILGRAAPLNRDIVRAGMTSCVADTSRMKRELLPTLTCPTIQQGLSLL